MSKSIANLCESCRFAFISKLRQIEVKCQIYVTFAHKFNRSKSHCSEHYICIRFAQVFMLSKSIFSSSVIFVLLQILDKLSRFVVARLTKSGEKSSSTSVSSARCLFIPSSTNLKLVGGTFDLCLYYGETNFPLSHRFSSQVELMTAWCFRPI